MFRLRVDDMDKTGNYVADYALQNITVGYLNKKNYPYTWDLTDLYDYATLSSYIPQEITKIANYDLKTVDTDHTNNIEFMNNTVGTDVKTVQLWKYYAAEGDIPAGYGLHVKNEPYSGGVMWDKGELYAGQAPFIESFGLGFQAPTVNQAHNAGLRICQGYREAVVTLTLVIPGSPWVSSEFTCLVSKGGQAVCLSDGLEPDPRAGPPF